eukprot:Seg3441.2 transcript_id=Seg3441.2/GoldUCD/mRNA.D3Y31 product="hypothetical protein" protein_id=Seg3441.2/GoldUCD/D3Y31
MIVTLFDDLNGERQEKALLDELYAKVAKTSGITSNPRDFASLSISAMLELQGANKPNLVYQWVKCILRRTGASALLPVNRMPFGLLQYQMEFFSCTNISQIHESEDYRKWLDTMEAEFGGRFLKLFRGPMWSGLDRVHFKDPTKAKVNIACASKHQHDNRLSADKSYTTQPGLQVSALQQLKEANPDGRFWIKLDATDAKAGIFESMRGVWN